MERKLVAVDGESLWDMEFAARRFCAGPISKKGHPHHPLYLRKDEKLKLFDAEEYLKKIGD